MFSFPTLKYLIAPAPDMFRSSTKSTTDDTEYLSLNIPELGAIKIPFTRDVEQTGFQPQQTGFQPQQPGFVPQQGGFQPQQTGFAPQRIGFMQQTGGFPQQGEFWQGGFQPLNAPTVPGFQQSGFQQTGFQIQCKCGASGTIACGRVENEGDTHSCGITVSFDNHNNAASKTPQQPALLPGTVGNRKLSFYPITRDHPFPHPSIALEPISVSPNGYSLYFGLAHLPNGSLTPCSIRIKRHESGEEPGSGGDVDLTVCVPFAGSEKVHEGECYLVPFDRDLMELVKVQGGNTEYAVKSGGERARKLAHVEGGKEDDGTPLHFAVGTVNGLRMPGKAGKHLVSGLHVMNFDMILPCSLTSLPSTLGRCCPWVQR